MFERPLLEPQTRNENFLNKESYDDEDFHLGIGEKLCWVKWLRGNGLGQGFIFQAIIPGRYTFP